MRPSGSPEELERRRRRALELLSQGLMPVEVAQQLGVDRRSVRRWKAAVQRRGAAGIAAQPASGRPPALDERARRQLTRLLLKGAQASGFATDLWTCPRVAELIQQRFGVEYHVHHVARLLHGLGFSPQKPTRRAVERDEEAIQQWVRSDWRRVKKTPDA
ncbi:IS630 family transposase [Solimonas sp. K1W22B-7]|uniref:IS630 family transposase n=1 Tax=Solimonas sp. K1W22B-7 TaxID=2303331 RepID=UPI000E32F418|nr:IS630 family transposase [Solimonas sp. K1W22B-7]AXQ27700.1 IS630 family transposase [Solimonas sp. K1W22B-7]AXQ29963.1 IS630 family transposase [Solimonas sp. K1W22B-7]AXQ30780.1 IS630 family transposase [Solimonas sp. K1W22B-7]